MRFQHYFHPSAIAAGFIAVLVGYSSSAVIIFQAAMVASVMTMFVFRGKNK